MYTPSYLGKKKRFNQLFYNKKTLIAPVDDSLLFGPFVALENMKNTVEEIVKMQPNAILGFKGTYSKYNMNGVPYIMNITASTTMGNHVEKTLISSPKEALIMGADCVAVHINYSSEYENAMIHNFSKVIQQADELGMPVLAIAYPRTKDDIGNDYNYEDIREGASDEYTKLICHVVRASVELGADIVKTQYTGNPKSFEKVVDSAMDTPVVIAGGPLVSVYSSYKMAREALDAGAAGISYGRNIFNATNISAYITGMKALIFDDVNVDKAVKIYEEYANVKLE